ncbi:MAG: hypothetical protein AABW72_00895 [archaeon]
MARARVNLIGRMTEAGRKKGKMPAKKPLKRPRRRSKVPPKFVLFMANKLKKAGRNILDDQKARTRIIEILRTRHGSSVTNAKTFLWRVFSYKSITRVMTENKCDREEAIDRLMWRYFGKIY